LEGDGKIYFLLHMHDLQLQAVAISYNKSWYVLKHLYINLVTLQQVTLRTCGMGYNFTRAS